MDPLRRTGSGWTSHASVDMFGLVYAAFAALSLIMLGECAGREAARLAAVERYQFELVTG